MSMTSVGKTIKQILKKNLKLIKRYGVNKVVKRVLSIVIIVITLFTSQAPLKPVLADEKEVPSAYTLLYTDYSFDIANSSVNDILLRSEVIDWQEAKTLIKKGENFKVLDPDSGTIINLKRTGGTNHMDVETLTKADTNKIKLIWGGFSWEKKGMILITNSGKCYIVSLHGMPHAGTDTQPGGVKVSYRSQGFGSGTNWDFIKDNGMNGHICIHFKNSKTHGTQKTVYKHQYEIQKLQQRKNKLFNSYLKEV